MCLDFWGRKSWSYIQALHFCLSMGLLIGPFLVDPLAHTKVPLIVQKALPINKGASGTANMPEAPAVTAEPAMKHPNINFRFKRELSDESEAEKFQTPDPLLTELFKPRIVLNEEPFVAVTSTELPKAKPIKPKPVFTDGRKLDNSRDWESVKVAKPPPEEVKPKKETEKSDEGQEEGKEEEEFPAIEDILGDEVSIEDILGNNIDEKNNSTAGEGSDDEDEGDDDTSIEEILGSSPTAQAVVDIAITTTHPPQTKSPALQEIEEEMTKIRKDIQKSQELLSKLESVKHVQGEEEEDLDHYGNSAETDVGAEEVILKRKRHRRSLRGNRPRSRDGFDEPVLYNQQRQRVPVPPIYPPDNQWPALQVPSRIADYQDYGNRFQPPSSLDYGYENRPKEVEAAIETIKEYMDGDLITNQPTTSSTTTTTTTTTTKAETTTTTTTSTTTTTGSTSSAAKSSMSSKSSDGMTTATTTTLHPHHKKPTSSFDNDTEDTITIQTYLDNYGVSKPNVGFILDAVYTILISLILFVCLCYNPREPRSRQEFEAGNSSRKVDGESRIFRYSLTVLLFFFSLLHWGMFVSMQHVLPKFYILATSAPYLQQVFIGVFTISR